ncbi:Outer membrane protein OmpA [Cognatiyoonia sediminum]|uniref:Outer membrane protein OmpA n=1 Tax=Cognatiyoonia sediminum TaxID=1508389 RepID=A0A1M5NCE4_9RHOB|nr:OmpA family protein [Cognatiyoonia sediminum]SHG87178.1 Outer membrane protein OmpA [Cognatiyoonia sediminum]
MKYLLIASAGFSLLAGCADPIREAGSFDREAGSQLDVGDFGNATMNNTLVQTGQLDYTINLARRFSAEVDDTINFAFDSSQLTAPAQATLRQQADWIKQFPEVRFKVFGHTDLVGSQSYNRSLGLRRAQSAVNYLVSQGIDRNRLEAVVSFGETQPLIQTESRDVRNRRTVTEVSGFVQNHPTVLNGEYARVIYREYVNSGTFRQQVSPLSISTGGGDIPGSGGGG